VVIACALAVAVAFGVDAAAVLNSPEILTAQVVLIICVAVLSTPLMRSDIQHRSDAVLDPLTGMLNRNALKVRVQELTQQSAVTGEPIGLIIGDLDHFKQINDTHGHSVGDAVLKEVAYLMRKQLRAFDLAYRLGGEEFLILLPGSDLPHAEDLAERLRARVGVENVAGGIGVTMSFGVSASGPDEPFDYTTVFARADAALYRAKSDGRDRVRLAEPEGLAVPVLA
jgi:diguanylate cyclase (GGDEF)-like protein